MGAVADAGALVVAVVFSSTTGFGGTTGAATAGFGGAIGAAALTGATGASATLTGTAAAATTSMGFSGLASLCGVLERDLLRSCTSTISAGGASIVPWIFFQMLSNESWPD